MKTASTTHMYVAFLFSLFDGAMDLGNVLKSLINVTTFINEMQLFMYNKSSIYFKSSIYNYVHSSSIKLRATPIKRYIHIYISLSHNCDVNLIGCFHTGNKHNVCKGCGHAHHDLHHSVMVITYLQSIVTAIWDKIHM